MQRHELSGKANPAVNTMGRDAAQAGADDRREPENACGKVFGHGTAEGCNDGGKGDLLMLCHRIPYPPDKGDKIRAFNMLKFLRESGWRVHVGALVDNPDDLAHAEALRAMCTSLKLVSVHPRRARLGSLTGIVRGTSMSVEYFRHPELQTWVDDTLNAVPAAAVLCVCAPMAEYLFRNTSIMAGIVTEQMAGTDVRPRLLLDFMDVDSEKWREYAKSGNPVMRLVYGLESMLLRRYEARIARVFDKVMLVSDAEAEVFRSIVLAGSPQVHDRVESVTNGVDVDFFAPQPVVVNRTMVFCGAMDYLPNIDAVEWFAQKVFPRIRQQHADAEFCIVGSNPADRVRALTDIPGVSATGKVPDVRPYVYDAGLSVVPLRIARGVQNKVLEAMSMGRPVLGTPQAMEGIRATAGHDVLEAPADPAAFGDAVLEFFASPEERAAALGQHARETIEREYTWHCSLKALANLLA